MLDKLFELIKHVFYKLLPFVVIEQYNRGVLLRLGKFKRVLEPGFHWRIPLSVDEILYEPVVPRTEHISGLSTTTACGKSIGCDAIITYEISDIRVAILEVHDVKDAISDTCAGEIGRFLSNQKWEEIVHGTVLDELTKVCRRRGKKWGINIISVQLTGVSLVKNIRISMSGHHANPPLPEM